MTDNPKVSVLIPCYNQQAVISDTIFSAINQTYENIEVIVTDDASTDNTPEILKALEKQYLPKLRLYLNETNLGITGNHTRGLQYCTGEFVAFLDGDDLFLPDKIQKQVSFMMQTQECTICYHDVAVFDTHTGKTLYFWSDRIGIRPGKINDLIRFGNYLPAVGVMARKKDLPTSGYDERLRVYSDWFFWLNTLYNGQGKICYFNEVLAKYRRHDKNLTNTWFWKTADQNLTLDIVEDTWPEFGFEARMRRSELQFMEMMNDIAQRKFQSAIKHLALAIKLGFPVFPWFRLIYREIKFFLKNGLSSDYIFKSIFSSK